MAKRKAPNTRAEIIDDDLAEFLGTDDCKMTEIRSLTKEYIEAEGLAEKADGKTIIYPDALMKRAFNIRGNQIASKDFWFKSLPAALKKKVEYYTP